MNVWGKLLTALRGGVNEVGEKLADSQALRILDQELRDANAELLQVKQSLVEIMAYQKTTESRVLELRAQIVEYEGYARQALAKQASELAREVAAKIADLETQCAEQQQLSDNYRNSADMLRANIHEVEQHLRLLRQQVDTVKATESVQQAQKIVAERFGGSEPRLHSAMESLARIQQRQALQAAKFAAASELVTNHSETELDKKLKEAGIVPTDNDAEAVLARLQAETLSAETVENNEQKTAEADE